MSASTGSFVGRHASGAWGVGVPAADIPAIAERLIRQHDMAMQATTPLAVYSACPETLRHD